MNHNRLKASHTEARTLHRRLSFLKVYFIDNAIMLSHLFLSFIPLCPATPFHQHSPTLVHGPVSYICKFFGFSISCTILNLSLSILYLPFMLLILCTFSNSVPVPLPADNPPCDLHFCDSVPVIVCLLCFCFVTFRFGC